MKQENKLTPREQQEQAQTVMPQSQAQEFSSVEEAFRADAAQTPVPPAVTQRLNESIRKEPKPRSWWQRFTGR
jgi:hypothetical protein